MVELFTEPMKVDKRRTFLLTPLIRSGNNNNYDYLLSDTIFITTGTNNDNPMLSPIVERAVIKEADFQLISTIISPQILSNTINF